jgi:DNA-binding transcriptional ArsR family regulator
VPDDGRDPLSDVFAALADPTRRVLLDRLLSDGPTTATVLAQDATVSRQAITKHLQILAAAGLVATERSGREVRYLPAEGPPVDAIGWLDATRRRWGRRPARLGRRLPVDRAGGQRRPRRPPRPPRSSGG